MEKIKIGENAGIVWRTLEELGELSLFDLCRKSSLSFEDATLAVGWLAREDKISIHKVNDMLMINLIREQNAIVFAFG